MTAPQKFRSAFIGFNREDVVHYIQFANSRHEAEVNQLKEQIEFYRKELAVQSVAAQQAEKDRVAALEQKCADLESENESLRCQLSDATQKQSSVDEELEAYRRAERTERLAKERAEKVYTRVNGVLSDATVKVDEASAQISEVSEQVLSRLSQLQSAVAGSKQALEEAVATMYAIRPTGEE